MSEEEIINNCKSFITVLKDMEMFYTYEQLDYDKKYEKEKQYKSIQGLLDLYQKEKEKNKELEKQMGKDLDVVYLQGVYNERDRWKDKIREYLNEYINDLQTEQDKADNEELISTEMDIRKNQIYVLERTKQELLEERN